jgi:Kef-type K+ transport system membrane component KefB
MKIAFYLILMSAIVAWLLSAAGDQQAVIDTGLKGGQVGPVALFLIQVVIVILASACCGALFKKCGQPRVIGEIMAGVILGPSLLGRLFPGISEMLFPLASLQHIQVLSQLGLIFFMFIVGMEVDPELINRKISTALVISHAGIAIPFSLGLAAAYFLYKDFAPAHVPFYIFSLFIGISMSVTAFPVLASIIRERGLAGTRLGHLAITCAAIDDVTAWCLLAIVLAIAKGGTAISSLYIILLTVLYAGGMLLLVRPLLRRLFAGGIKGYTLPLTFAMLLTSACCSELIGIHALFGAFIAGISMPADKHMRTVLNGAIEDMSVILLLPLFFVYTGLRTRLDLIDSPTLWAVCGLIILVAIAGKLGGSAIAARCMGESPRDSLIIGALMNTRGLVELVVLNIGYDIGILSPALFTIMLVMALFTTCMTGPILNLVERRRVRFLTGIRGQGSIKKVS